MRIFLSLVFCFCSVIALGQSDRFSLNIIYRPEITSYKDSISYRWKEKIARHSWSSFGFRIEPEYHFSNRFFARSGIGFINRIFRNTIFFNQALAVGDSTMILLMTEKTTYRIVELPIAIGYSILNKPQVDFNILIETSFNYLVNAYYKPPRYEGTYKKHYWLGSSYSMFFSFNYKLKPEWKLVVESGYVLKNDVRKDELLFSQDEPSIAIKHSYIPIMLGINYYFR